MKVDNTLDSNCDDPLTKALFIWDIILGNNFFGVPQSDKFCIGCIIILMWQIEYQTIFKNKLI